VGAADHPFWHPFADMALVPGHELELAEGDGATVRDERGRRYVDLTGGLWFCNVGHGRRALAEAAAAQMRRLAAFSTFGRLSHRQPATLARRVCELAPVADAAAFFTTGGSEAVETAAKIARRYWRALGEPQRTLVVAREGAYHGMSAYGTSLAGIPANAEGYGTLVPGVVRVPAHDAEAVAQALRAHPGQVAAVIGEPVIGAGGVLPPPPGYWAEVQRAVREDGALLVADEVVTGFGRLGSWFACERLGIAPDLLLVAKGITSGYAPLGAVLASARVRAPFWDGTAGPFRHGYTYSGHPAACAVAHANLDVLEDEGLVARARALEPVLARLLGGLAGAPLVSAVRSIGLMGAVELDADAVRERPGLAQEVADAALRHGALTRVIAGRALQVSPPFVIAEDELAAGLAGLARALEEVSAGALAPAGATG